MLTIHKFTLPIQDEIQTIKLPPDSEILSLQIQHGEPQLWFLLQKDCPEQEKKSWHFRWYGTGQDLNEQNVEHEYVGTVQLRGGQLVFHLFEVENKLATSFEVIIY